MEKSCSHCGKPVDSHGAKGYCATCYARFRRNGTADKRTPMVAGNCSHCGEPVGPKGAKGYCAKHYARFKRHGDPNISLIDREHADTCSECDQPVVAKGYCTTHYQRWQRHGDPSVVLSRKRVAAYSIYPRGSSRKYSLNHGYFEDIETPEQAYWLGFITADGNVINRKGTYALRIDLQGRDEPHLRLFLKALDADYPIRNNRGCAQIAVNSPRLVNDLVALGVTERKSATVEPWNGPTDLMSHYWRGLFDGDGSICRSRDRWQMGICGSMACVETFATWARAVCGSRAKALPVRPGATCWQWIVGGTRMTRLLAQALYEDAPVALDRKQQLAETILA